MATFEEDLDLEIEYTDRALKYAKNKLSEINRGHIGPAMKEKIMRVPADLVRPLRLAVESAGVLHGMSPARQGDLLIILDDIENQHLADFDRLLNEERKAKKSNKEAAKDE